MWDSAEEPPQKHGSLASITRLERLFINLYHHDALWLTALNRNGEKYGRSRSVAIILSLPV